MAKEDTRMTKKDRTKAVVILLVFFIVILSVAAGMTVKNSLELQDILTASVESQLISISLAAREIIDPAAFEGYSDAGVASLPEYQDTLTRLRGLKNSVGAEYIYALKLQDGAYVFVFDTDEENEEIFIPYELSPVHEAAFTGRNAADILNVSDEYGSFNTGAVPIYNSIGAIIGVISADTEDTYIAASMAASRRNAVVLVAVLVVAMVAMLFIVLRLLNKLKDMQGRLEHQAHYDAVTGLPNRQYLMEYLQGQVSKSGTGPFAMYFVDLDNFKSVNDNAGHDAGDELLRHIGQYLEGSTQNAMSFRPAAGQLNVAARIGGDEFVQLVHGISTREEAAKLAQQLLDGFKNQHFDRYIDKYGVGLSIGVALYPYHSENYHVLIKYADTAMYHAKHGGKNQYRLYEDEMGKEDYIDPLADPDAPKKSGGR